MSDTKPSHILVARCFVFNPYTGKFLILRRTHGKRNEGKWEPPGGKVERGETVAHALHREILEETGLREIEISFAERPAYESHIADDSDKDAGALVMTISFFSTLTGIPGSELHNPKITLDPREHDGSEWVPYKDLRHFELTSVSLQAAIQLKRVLTTRH